MKRFLEPSTWAGIAGILSPVAAFLPGLPGMILGSIAAACGGAAVYLREHGAV